MNTVDCRWVNHINFYKEGTEDRLPNGHKLFTSYSDAGFPRQPPFLFDVSKPLYFTNQPPVSSQAVPISNQMYQKQTNRDFLTVDRNSYRAVKER